MAKCELCGERIATTFLGKLVGTKIKNTKGKFKSVCSQCQKEHKGEDLKELIENK